MRYLHLIFRFYSRLVKAIANIYIPQKIRNSIFTALGKHAFGMSNKDFELLGEPLNKYKNINEFFTRPINLKKREIHHHKIISPCEGKIIEFGDITEKDKMVQIKGISYSLKKLLLNDSLASYFQDGSFCNIYLSPHNYHRFHVPCSGVVDYIKHIPGACFPVNKSGQKICGLYTFNERYIVAIKSKNFRICMAIVGAAAVREIKIFQTVGTLVNKGDLLGMFALGSSIVLISDKRIFSHANVRPGEVNVLGQILISDGLM